MSEHKGTKNLNIDTNQGCHLEELAKSSLLEERKNASFDVRKLTYFLDGSEDITQAKELVYQIIERDPELRVKEYYDQARPDARSKTMQQLRRFIEVRNSLKNPLLERIFYKLLDDYDPTVGMKGYVHEVLFRETIWAQGTKEQWEKYADDIRHMRIFGCYAMTELGHSSNLQGVETTATFDKSTQEFIVHTPTLTATKWWIGAAGQTATHTVALCKTIVDGTDKGLNWFIVPLRSRKDGRLLPGVSCGDVGSKMGRNGLDNGWIQFSYVRIPKENMLMKWSQIHADGTFVAPPNQALVYASLIGERLVVVPHVSDVLSHAVTIAVRYGACRRQGYKDQQILDYQGFQVKVCPIIATCVAVNVYGRMLRGVWEEALEMAQHEDTKGNFVAVTGDMHAITAGMKTWLGWWGVEALEDCRRCLGGHGYSSYNSIAGIISDYAVITTGGGDNIVLAQQCARFLLGGLKRVMQGKRVAGSIKYLNEFNADKLPQQKLNARNGSDLRSGAVQVEALKWLSMILISNAATQIQQEVMDRTGSGSSFEDAWNNHMMAVVEATRPHVYFLLVSNFVQEVEKVEDVTLKATLKRLSDLFALHNIEKMLAQFLEHGYVTRQQVQLIRTEVLALCQEVRKEAVPLVDAFNIPDYIIKSPFGKFNGDIYSSYFATVNAAPNAQGVPSWWQTYMGPQVHAKM